MSGTTVGDTPRQAAWSRLVIVAGGYFALVVLGVLIMFPSVSGEMFFRQLIGRALDAPWAPFGDEDPEGKTWLSLVGLLFGLPLLAGAVAIARAVRRRLSAAGSAAALHYALCFVLFVVPILVLRAVLFE